MRISNDLRFIISPLCFLLFFIIFALLYNSLGLPTGKELIDIAKHYYLDYGYITVFIAALIEGLLVINWYLPGSFVIVLGVIFSIGDPLRTVFIVFIITFAFFLTSIINYLFGRFAWYKFLLFLGLETPLKKMKQKVEKYGLLLIFSTYFHPNIGGLTALSAGILKLAFVKFLIYSLIALIIWNAVWGLVVYFSGSVLLNLLNITFLIVILFCWLVFGIFKYFLRRVNC